MLARNAAREPDRIAVDDGDRSWTNRQVLGLIGELRSQLVAAGCGRYQVVAVDTPRSLAAVISFLAIESVGGVYFPLDRSWPDQRLVEAMRAADVRLLLRWGEAHPPEGGGDRGLAELACVPTLAGDFAALVGAAAAHADVELASVVEAVTEKRYVMQTSGSTGTPKGVMIEHRSMLNHCWTKIGEMGLHSDDVIALSSPLAYTPSISQMCIPIMLGGRLAILDEEALSFPRRLIQRLGHGAISVLETVPTVLDWLCTEIGRSGDRSTLGSVRWLISTGEALSPEVAVAALDAFPEARLLNAYGFTETSDDVAHHIVTRADTAAARIPVGRPSENTSLYVLVPEGASWRPAQPGEPGELIVGGLPPCAGYIGGPGVDGVSFVTDLLDPDSPTRRLYVTGDRAAVEGGVLYCLGRSDRRVNISGARINLDEIETVLNGHPMVHKSAVVTHTHADGRVQIAAYYEANTEEIDDDNIIAYLSPLLAPNMRPRTLSLVDELPLNANGKIDYPTLERWAR